MHTRNVNVKTATEESSRKMGVTASVENAHAAALLIRQYSVLQPGVTVMTSGASRHGDVQIEIRRFEAVIWHGWSFQPDFLKELESHLRDVGQR
ncbi:TPA: hypothetical protein RKY22_005631 [Klebsiella michiganensis]|nr:hypothetical protein [Klebsiella variicola]HDW0215010.1 hypothetical protein [Klebsiella michiganensis]